MPTFDGDNLIITLDSAVTSIDIQEDLYEPWKLWAKEGNLRYPQAFRVAGGDDAQPGLKTGSYFFLQNQKGWRIRPPEEDINISVTGNLLAEDSTLDIAIPTIGAFTAFVLGLQPITQSVSPLLSLVDYIEKSVWLNVDLAAAGDGSQKTPFNDLAVAIDYAEAENIRSMNIHSDITLDRSLKNFNFVGAGVPTIDCAGFDIGGSEFHTVALQGTYIGQVVARDCNLLTSFALNGFFENCALAGDLIMIAGGGAFVKNCATNTPPGTAASISMNGGGASTLKVHDHQGSLIIKDCDNVGDSVVVGMSHGELNFDSSNTLGSMIARGFCSFTDATAGSTVTDETGNPSGINISRKILQNYTETDPVTGLITVYDDDKVTVLFTANIWENVAKTTPYAGNAVNSREALE